MKQETQITIHQIIEYIKQDIEFPFDTHDDPEEILNHYQINQNLKTTAKELLKTEIREITEKAQTREIIRQTIETGVVI